LGERRHLDGPNASKMLAFLPFLRSHHVPWRTTKHENVI